MKSPVLRFLGSLQVAIATMLTIATMLACGTAYEARFGTAAVQRFIYRAWWFQGVLGFLAVNLALAALERRPWQRKHLPFLMAHLGIILILLGGILGGRFGIDGQLIIPEGQANRVLQLPANVLVVSQPNPGLSRILPTVFETTAWIHEPHALFSVPLDGRSVDLVVDRYYPDAVVDEQVTNEGDADHPAIRLTVSDGPQQDRVWLLADDPERFGMGWGQAHLLFLKPAGPAQLDQLLGRATGLKAVHGTLTLTVPGKPSPYEIPVPERFGQAIPLNGTSYRVTFKDYFPDFALSGHGPVNRSDQPNNPAIAFTVSGPEGVDPYLLFAFHPEFQAIHGFQHPIKATVSYRHPEASILPPNTVAVLQRSNGALAAVMTGAAGERQVVDPLRLQTRYTHPSLGYTFEVSDYAPRAKLTQSFTNRGDEIHLEAVHVMAQDGPSTAEAWVGLRETARLSLGAHPITVAYRPDERTLPWTIKLLDFRKIDYPGTQMASAFESDVELTDPQRGVILLRTISMNNPLRYRGYSFFQSSYVPGTPETTVLSVRNDPGTPCVYAGFLIVIAGVVLMFLTPSKTSASKRRRSA